MYSQLTFFPTIIWIFLRRQWAVEKVSFTDEVWLLNNETGAVKYFIWISYIFSHSSSYESSIIRNSTGGLLLSSSSRCVLLSLLQLHNFNGLKSCYCCYKPRHMLISFPIKVVFNNIQSVSTFFRPSCCSNMIILVNIFAHTFCMLELLHIIWSIDCISVHTVSVI